jgi:hypothetical protein
MSAITWRQREGGPVGADFRCVPGSSKTRVGGALSFLPPSPPPPRSRALPRYRNPSGSTPSRLFSLDFFVFLIPTHVASCTCRKVGCPVCLISPVCHFCFIFCIASLAPFLMTPHTTQSVCSAVYSLAVSPTLASRLSMSQNVTCR